MHPVLEEKLVDQRNNLGCVVDKLLELTMWFLSHQPQGGAEQELCGRVSALLKSLPQRRKEQ